ncbi:MAG: carboxypeptidase-like regulatory domain-containing protein, partial [Planctomycetota bacterium]
MGADKLRVEFSEGSPGDTGVHVVILAENSAPIDGYSLSISYPSEVLILTRFGIEGTHIGDVGPSFVSPRFDGGGRATLGVIFAFDEPFEPSPLSATEAGDAPRIVARLTFSVRENAEGGEYPIRLVDGLGNPPSYNRFSVRGTSITPDLEDNVFRIEGPNRLWIDRKIAFPGIVTPSITMFAIAAHPDPLIGYTVAVNYECARVELLAADLTQTFVGLTVGRQNDIEFFRTDVDRTIGGGQCRSRTAVVFEYPTSNSDCPVPVLPPSENGHSILRYRFRVDGENLEGREHLELALTQQGATSLNSSYMVDQCPNAPRTIEPLRRNGKIYFSQGELRGRVVDAVDARPLVGVNVELAGENRNVTTRSDGSFTFTDAIPGDYRIRLSKEGFYFASAAASVTGRSEIDELPPVSLYEIPDSVSEPTTPFLRGDSNGDGLVDLSDGIFILSLLFLGGPSSTCEDSLDANDSGIVNIS